MRAPGASSSSASSPPTSFQNGGSVHEELMRKAVVQFLRGMVAERAEQGLPPLVLSLGPRL
eukprot:1180564-Alexandrium_andersonii.AAC.1